MATEGSAQPDEDLVGLYLREVGRQARLTGDEEVRLARAIEDGRAAHERLAQAQDGQRSSGRTRRPGTSVVGYTLGTPWASW